MGGLKMPWQRDEPEPGKFRFYIGAGGPPPGSKAEAKLRAERRELELERRRIDKRLSQIDREIMYLQADL